MKVSFSESIASAVASALELASDRLVRVDARPSWPLEAATLGLLREKTDLRVGLLSPFRRESFSALPPDSLEVDAATLTVWRNEREGTQSADFPLVLFGSARGREESGLKSIYQVVTLVDVTAIWLDSAQSLLDAQFSSQELKVRTALLSAIMFRVSTGETKPSAAEAYIDLVLNAAQLADLQEGLWHVGLMPDDGLVAGAIEARLRRNDYLLEIALHQEPEAPYKRLSGSSEPAARALVKWAETRDPINLSGTELTRVEKIMFPPSVRRRRPEEPPPQPRARDVLDVLADARLSIDVRRRVLESAVSVIDDSDLQAGSINKSFTSPDAVDSFIALTGGAVSEQWTAGPEAPDGGPPSDEEVTDSDDESDAADEGSSDYAVALLNIGASPDLVSKAFTSSAFQRYATDRGYGALVESYLEARETLLQSARLLAGSSQDLLALLVVSPRLRERASTYLEAWSTLLKHVTTSYPDEQHTLLALLEGEWSRPLNADETLASVRLNTVVPYSNALLCAWHPWRVEPLLELAEEVVAEYEQNPTIVEAARWAIDRAIPAYRLLEIPPARLEYQTVQEGCLSYAADRHFSLPPASGSGKSVRHALTAYLSSHPWAAGGITVLLANPPRGGMTERLMAPERLGGTEASVIVLRDRKIVGLEQADSVTGLSTAQDVSDVARWVRDSRLEQDVALAFIVGNPAQFGGLRHGAHGNFHLVLRDDLADFGGSRQFTPQIVVRADEGNDLVLLLYRAAGLEEATAATYELAIRENDRAIIGDLVSKSGWTIVAVPSTVGAFDVRLRDGTVCPRVAEFDEGSYRCFVFARTLEPLEWAVRDRIRQLPVSQQIIRRLTELLDDLASSQPQKLFDIARNRFGTDEALGVMCARDLAAKAARPDDLIIEISLDDSSWTRDWLERDGQRADFVLVLISGEENDPEPIRFVAVEAKARTDSFHSPSLSDGVFEEAVSQVEATMDRLQAMLASDHSSFIARLKMRALTEQISASAAAKYTSATDKKLFPVYFNHLNMLAEDPQAAVRDVTGLAVAVFLGGQEPVETLAAGELTVVSASARLLEAVLLGDDSGWQFPADGQEGGEGTGGPGPTPEPNAPGGSPTPQPSPRALPTRDVDEVDVGGSSPAPANDEAAIEEGIQELSGGDAAQEELIRSAFTALRLRTEDVSDQDDVQVSTGPTFTAISFGIRPGASLAPIRRANIDLARDMGVSSVEVSNSSERGRIQLLVPREQREFPRLPDREPDSAAGDYLNLWIGVGLAGENVSVPASRLPHALVSGTTGSGKTTFLRSVLSQLDRYGPQASSIIVVDGKDEADYLGLVSNDLFSPEFPEPIPSAAQSVHVFDWLLSTEIPRRRQLIKDASRASQTRIEARTDYVEAMRTGRDPMMLPLVIVIDEFNQLMLSGGSAKAAFVNGVTSITQAARSVLVHLVLATQRPDRQVLPGAIKANLSTRFAFRLPTASDSLTVLGHGGAEQLLGAGDMLMQLNGEEDVRLQGYVT